MHLLAPKKCIGTCGPKKFASSGGPIQVVYFQPVRYGLCGDDCSFFQNVLTRTMKTARQVLDELEEYGSAYTAREKGDKCVEILEESYKSGYQLCRTGQLRLFTY